VEDQLIYASFVNQVVHNGLVFVEEQRVMILQLLHTWNGEVKISHKNHNAKRRRMEYVLCLWILYICVWATMDRTQSTLDSIDMKLS